MSRFHVVPPTFSGIVHVCYVCRHFTIGGIATDDILLTDEEENFPANVSHGVCKGCEPGEWARIEAACAAIGV